MAAVRANTMQAITSKIILSDGHPPAATISGTKAKGSAKIVCEKRINRRNRLSDPFPNCPIILRELLFSGPHAASVVVAFFRRDIANDCRSSEVGSAAIPVSAHSLNNPLLVEILLARVMWLVCFRFGQFFGRFFLRLERLGVEDAGLLEALVRESAKEIAF